MEAAADVVDEEPIVANLPGLEETTKAAAVVDPDYVNLPAVTVHANDFLGVEQTTTIFSHPVFGDLKVVVGPDGNPWFLASQVAKALGYAKPENAVAAHCKRKGTYPLKSGGQVRHVTIIPEGDLYRLAARSKLPTADQFESWVFDEVLPSIRKTGGYVGHAAPEDTPEVIMAAKGLMAAKEEAHSSCEAVVAVVYPFEKLQQNCETLYLSRNATCCPPCRVVDSLG